MHFTHRKHHNPSLWFGNQVIKPQETELRWLGLWLDPKLTFGAHIQRIQQKGNATIAQLRRISRCYHGLSPKETRLLVSTILKPRILFGSIVWFNTRTEGKVTKLLNLLQIKSNRLILGAFKSSPVQFMNHDVNAMSFRDLVVRHHHNYIYKRLTAPPHTSSTKIITARITKYSDHTSESHPQTTRSKKTDPTWSQYSRDDLPVPRTTMDGPKMGGRKP